MADKTELVEKINGLLGVKLESLERMTREDLEKMLKVLGDPASMIRLGVDRAEAELKRPLREFLDRPVMDLLYALTGRGEGERFLTGWYPGKIVRETLLGERKEKTEESKGE